jgi:hypothetical protein
MFFYNINTVFKYSTTKKDLNPKMKMGTNSFGVHIVKPYCPFLRRKSINLKKSLQLAEPPIFLNVFISYEEINNSTQLAKRIGK